MKYEPVKPAIAAGRKSLSRDFRLIARAIADAFRGLSAQSGFDCRCPKVRYGGWR
jgi:hypothetical protein